MISMEKQQKINNRVENKFRTTKVWHLKIVLCTIFCLFTIRTAIPDEKVAIMAGSEHLDLFDRLLYDKIIQAVVQVESRGNTLAYNLKEGATGAFQIRSVRVLDYNRRTGKNYKLEDCYNYEISREIFLFYAKRIGNENVELIARKWNGSGKATEVYWGKVKLYL